jgi:organic radical activating enzyme
VIVNYLITLSKNWHNENSQKFLYAKKEVEKIKRIKATKMLKEKELIKIQSKIQEILDKNNKIVVLPKKKVPEKSMVNNNSKRRLIKSQDFNKNNSFLEVMQQFHKFLEE